MALKIYNTLSKEKEEFVPLKGNHVGLYTCGPTVYAYPHIGNYRAYVFGDMLKRYLKYKEYRVNHVMNITDIDDKTIKNSRIAGKTLKEFTEFYTEAFMDDIKLLNIEPADIYTKATDYISQMVKLIKTLEEKGFAYKTEDNSVYFDIKKDKEYGKLSGFILSDLKDNAKGRLNNDEYEKDNAQDFALWKAWTKDDGDVYWDTDLGKGRPGWHIECSAMSMDKLGESFDIHTGGVDNIFPHHENEIAQSECATGKPFAKYFMHNEHLLVDGQKMSKSLGNFYTLNDLKQKGVDPIAFRMWLYTSNYTTRTNFTLDTVNGTQIALNKLRLIVSALGDTQIGTVDNNYKEQFVGYMDDNLDSPKALALLWELAKDQNISDSDKKATILDFDKVFGFGLDKIKKDIIPEEIEKLGKERGEARKNKDWAKSDELRDEIKNLGYEVVDVESGYKISKI